MTYKKIEWDDIAVEVGFSIFSTKNGVNECHAMIQNKSVVENAGTQYKNVETAILRLSGLEELINSTLILKRYFASDAINHESLLKKDENIAVSIVQQPPLNGTKVSLWAYWVENCTVKSNGADAVVMERPAYKHLFNMQLHSHGEDEYIQTEDIFKNYTQQLTGYGCSLKNNTIRTWIYVQGVDTHYADMVKSRKSFFEKEGLTKETHYIASTGIEGKYLHPETTVFMDAYSIANIREEQVSYLKGASHLNPTHEYGVTFERATSVDYGDRRHIFVSGTASIDNKGNIVHPLQIEKQIERTFENIQVLLEETESGRSDIAQMIVYLRDTADYGLVFAYMEKYYPETPKVIVWAPVCRPGWLIEVECIAIKESDNPMFEKF